MVRVEELGPPRIRRVSPSHPALDEIDKLCLPYDPPYKKEGAWWWIIRQNGRAVAFAGLKDVGENTAFLCRAGVLRDYRGQGFQRRLIRVRLAEAKRRGFAHVVTYTSPDNTRSANNLLREGMSLYSPKYPYAMTGALYFIKEF